MLRDAAAHWFADGKGTCRRQRGLAVRQRLTGVCVCVCVSHFKPGLFSPNWSTADLIIINYLSV